jgi:hypothetical protein
LKNAYAYKKLKAGVIALGTDFPVEEVNNVDFSCSIQKRIAKVS